MVSDRISYDANGNMLIEGIKLSVKKNSYKIPDSFKNAIKNIELQFKNAAISEEEYYKNMENLRDSYLEKGTTQWWSYTNKIIKYENDLIKEQEKTMQKAIEEEKKQIEKAYEEIAKVVYKKQDEIMKEQERFRKKLSDFVKVSEYEKYIFPGIGPGGGDYVEYFTELGDLDAQKEKLKDYYNLLMTVKTLGVSHFGEEGFHDFFEMLKSYSVDEGAGLAKKLLKQSDEGFFEFVKDWNEIQSLTDEFSKKLGADNTKIAAKESLDMMQEVLAEYGLEVPEGFYVSGSVSAQKFGEGFVSEIDGVLADITKRFETFMPGAGVLFKASENAGMKKSVFAPTYNLYGSGETVAEQLKSASRRALLDRLRGGY